MTEAYYLGAYYLLDVVDMLLLVIIATVKLWFQLCLN